METENTTTTVTSNTELSETTTATTVTSYPLTEQITYMRGTLELIAGLLLALVLIELCKWCYRFLNIFFPI